MSIIASRSPSVECVQCGARYAANVMRLGNETLTGTPADVMRGGQLYTQFNGSEVVVCDVCLYSALRTAFGDLLRP